MNIGRAACSLLRSLPGGSPILRQTGTGLNILPVGLPGSSRGFHASSINNFILTAPSYSAMMKKKRRSDPGQTKAKEDRRQKKLVKALKKMEKKDRQEKPLLELEVPVTLHTEAAIRTRGVAITEEESERRHYLKKDWSKFALQRHRNAIWEQDKRLLAQQEAMQQLRLESEQLYMEACQIDPELIPFSAFGPTITPPIQDYLQDGEYTDTTRQFKVVYEDTEAFLKKLLARDRRRKRKTEEEED